MEPKTAPLFSVFDNPSRDEVESVVTMLRPEDVDEFAAWGVMKPYLVTDAFVVADYKWIAYQREYPVFCFGLKKYADGGYYLMGFGAQDIDKCTLRRLTRWGVREWMPFLFYQLNIRRIEAIVPIQSTHSINWLRWCGMKIEGSSKDYIKRGDRFVRLAYTITDYEADNDYVFHAESISAPDDSSANDGTNQERP